MTEERIFLEAASEEEALEMLHEMHCTDGLPVVIPTLTRVAEFVLACGQDADMVIGELGPAMGLATVQKVAAAAVMAGCKPDSVLVVHSPPLDTVDHDSTGQIRGSQAIREVVETVQPKLVVCGHIHSDWEKQCRIAKTQVLNAGPRGVLIEIDVTGD